MFMPSWFSSPSTIFDTVSAFLGTPSADGLVLKDAARATSFDSIEASSLFPANSRFFSTKFFRSSIAPSRFAPSGPMELWRRSKFRRLLDPCSPAATSSNTPLSPSEFLDRPSRSRDRFRASASPMNLAPSALSLQDPSSKTRSAGDSERPAASAFAPSAPIIILLRSSSWSVLDDAMHCAKDLQAPAVMLKFSFNASLTIGAFVDRTAMASAEHPRSPTRLPVTCSSSRDA
mmetsp:Transcript_6702/g.29520  ORF Transcript_6702/g.29520 Transcript_6702/m.29520 type:complete len:232 (-) Transcript_6702:558-1253(-)